MAVKTREPNEGLRRHKLLPVEIRERMPKLGSQDGLGADAIVQVKYFSPYSGWTWLATEFDGEDTFFGYVVSGLGPDCSEWGYFSLSELATVTVLGGVPAVERDRGFGGVPVRECRGAENA